jgi:hypothetical protein
MIIPKPEIGSRVRITAKWPSGLKTITEGTYTGWCEPDWELDGFFRVSYSDAGHSDFGGNPLPDVHVEILSLPEPADGTWLTTPNRIPSRPPYVFHRNDAAVLEAHATLAEAGYRWYFHEDGEWTTWANVQGYGAVTVIKDGAL